MKTFKGLVKEKAFFPSREDMKGKGSLFLFISIAIHAAAGFSLSKGTLFLANPKEKNLPPIVITLHPTHPNGQIAASLLETPPQADATGAKPISYSQHATTDGLMSSEKNKKNTEPGIEGVGGTETIETRESQLAQIQTTTLEEKAIYFRPQDVTERPQLLQDIEPNLRITVSDLPTQTAVLRLLINELGYIDKVEVTSSRLPNEVESLISNVFSTLKFIPGKRNGISVRTWIKVEVLLENVIRIPISPNMDI